MELRIAMWFQREKVSALLFALCTGLGAASCDDGQLITPDAGSPSTVDAGAETRDAAAESSTAFACRPGGSMDSLLVGGVDDAAGGCLSVSLRRIVAEPSPGIDIIVTEGWTVSTVSFVEGTSCAGIVTNPGVPVSTASGNVEIADEAVDVDVRASLPASSGGGEAHVSATEVPIRTSCDS